MHPLPIGEKCAAGKSGFRRPSRAYMTKMGATTTDHTDGLAAVVLSETVHICSPFLMMPSYTVIFSDLHLANCTKYFLLIW